MSYQLPYDAITADNGLVGTLVYIAQQVPIFFPVFLILFWVMIVAGGYISEDKRTGQASLMLWSTLGGFIVTIASFVLFLYPGIITLPVVVLFLSITIISAFIYFLTDR